MSVFISWPTYKIIQWLGQSSGFCYHKLATNNAYIMLPQATQLWCIQINVVGTRNLCLPVSSAGCVKCFAGSGAEEESTGQVAKQ